MSNRLWKIGMEQNLLTSKDLPHTFNEISVHFELISSAIFNGICGSLFVLLSKVYLHCSVEYIDTPLIINVIIIILFISKHINK